MFMICAYNSQNDLFLMSEEVFPCLEECMEVCETITLPEGFWGIGPISKRIADSWGIL